MPRQLIQRSPNTSHKIWDRYFRFRAGATPEDIAKVDGVTLNEVNACLRSAEVYMQAHSLESTNSTVSGTIIQVMPEVTKSLKRALTKKTTRKSKNGKMVTEHDTQAQMRAVSEVTGLVVAIQPKGNKGGDMNLNVNQQTAVIGKGFSEETYKPGVEERIDAIRSRVAQQNLLPRQVGTPDDPDAELEIEEEEDNAIIKGASSEDAPEVVASDS